MALTRSQLPAKLSSPRLSGIVHRERLYDLFDRLQQKPLLWLAGPPGAGKTTLVAGYQAQRGLRALWYRMDAGDADIASFFHYLAIAGQAVSRRRRSFLPALMPEHLPNLELYTRRFFQALAAALPTPSLLIFDNLHDVPPAQATTLHAVLRSGLEELSPGTRVVLISREPPPVVFARAQAYQTMAVVDWQQLKLTEQEAVDIARLQCGDASPALPAIRRLHAQTDGWLAGLLLGLQEKDDRALGAVMPSVFDYLAGEIFDRTAAPMQEFLIESVFLPTMTPHTAQALTGLRDAGRYLAELHRQHYFVERKSTTEPVYQYHPLFHDFLRARAEATLSPDTLADIRRRAAAVLEAAEDQEAALNLLLESGDTDQAVTILLALAPRLVAQGRYQTLTSWLERFVPLAFQHAPRLLYWRGTARLPFDPARSRADFEGAFRALQERPDDPAGIFLSWAGFVEANLFVANEFAHLDRWIVDLEALIERFPDFPDEGTAARVASAMTTALLYHRPDHPRIAQWAERAVAGGARREDPNLRVSFCVPAANYYCWIGNPARYQSVMAVIKTAAADPRATPLSRILACVWEGLGVCYGAAPETVRRAVDEGLAIAAANGIHVQDFFLFKAGISAAIDEGDITGAADYLARMTAIVHQPEMTFASLYHYVSAWFSLHAGDVATAARQISRSCEMIDDRRMPFPESFTRLLFAYIQSARGHNDEAEAALAVVRRTNESVRSALLSYMGDLCEAHLCLAVRGPDGDSPVRRERGLAALGRAMALSREHGFFTVATFPRAALARLCAEALSAGIEIDHVRTQIRRYRLAPPDHPQPGPGWPWPIRIHTLGGFSVLIDDQPLKFGRKAPRKPLALLQALIAAGGCDVHEDPLVDALWPEADGDTAHWAFAITVRRLRELLNAGPGVIRTGKRLSLDPHRVWVDAWAVEALLDRIELALRGAAEANPAALTHELLTLYRGDFLAGAADEPWVLDYRARLRRRAASALAALAAHWERGDTEQAHRCREKAREIMPRAEGRARG